MTFHCRRRQQPVIDQVEERFWMEVLSGKMAAARRKVTLFVFLWGCKSSRCIIQSLTHALGCLGRAHSAVEGKWDACLLYPRGSGCLQIFTWIYFFLSRICMASCLRKEGNGVPYSFSALIRLF